MNDALTTLDSWMKGLRMSLTDAALALHGSAVPREVPPEALAKLRCSLFATNNALDELLDQLKGTGTPSNYGNEAAVCVSGPSTRAEAPAATR